MLPAHEFKAVLPRPFRPTVGPSILLQAPGRIVRGALAFALIAALGACGSPDGGGSRSNKSQTLVVNIGAEPETLDPAKATGVLEHRVINAMMRGLTRLDEKGIAEPSLAERWESNADGTEFTFHLREAKWSNGDPITAEDFVWSWQRAVSPQLASEYAYQLFYVKNAEEINGGKSADPASLGIEAADKRTLKVSLTGPTPFFPALVAHGVSFPVHRPTVERQEDWHRHPQSYVCSGPFRMTEWAQDERVVTRKNPKYWDAERVKLDTLAFRMIPSEATMLAAFDTDQLDVTNTVPRVDLARLKGTPEYHTEAQTGTYFVNFNCKKAPFDIPKVRKAFTLAIDRGTIVSKITQANEEPALAWIPTGIPDPATGGSFRVLQPSYYRDNDVEAARGALAEAGFPEGRGFPPVTYIFNTTDMHKTIGETLQEMWRKTLGVEVALQNQEWKTYLSNRNQGNFDLARGSWVGDFPDALNFLDVYLSHSGNNSSHWESPGYDALIRETKATADPVQRSTLMHDAETMFMEDWPIAPIYFYTEPYLEKTWVHGVRRNPLGTWDFSEAWIQKENPG